MLKKRNRRDKEIMIRSKRSISVLIIILALVFNTNFEVLVYADNGLNYLENNNMLINNKIINIPDKALKAAINRELGQSKDSNITKSQLESLTGIYAPNYNINDITGIEYCINLRALDLKDNNISDISALSNLIKLRKLYLENNNISDISALKNLNELDDLDLNNNNISDISALSNMDKLYWLDLSNNNISDISALRNSNKLWYLYLSNNNISDISALSNLNKVWYLYINNNNISDISALRNLEYLWDLELNNNNISDISALRNLNNLSYLYLSDNNISNISALSNLNQLERLYLSNNNISDISALSSLNELYWLYLGNNNISDISALSNLNKLNNLELNNNNISDISPLKGKVIECLNAENQLIELEKVILDSNSLKVKNLIKGEDGNLLSPSFISNNGYYDGVNDIVWNNLNNQQEVYYEFNYDKIIDEEYGEFKYSGKVVQPIEYKNVNNPDVNGDGAVDINDIAMIALKYNKTSDDRLWDENLDINKDRIIDLYDLIIVAREL